MKKAHQAPVSQASAMEVLQRTDVGHWQDVARRVSDPVTARLIVKLLDEDPYLREHRIGVYLAASETVKRSQIRYARWHRHGKTAGALLRFARWGVLRVFGALTSMLPTAKTADIPEPGEVSVEREHADATPVTLVFPPIVDPFANKATLIH